MTVTPGKAGRSRHGRIGSRPGGEFRTTAGPAWARDRRYSKSAASRARAAGPGTAPGPVTRRGTDTASGIMAHDHGIASL